MEQRKSKFPEIQLREMGFRISYELDKAKLLSRSQNMKTAIYTKQKGDLILQVICQYKKISNHWQLQKENVLLIRHIQYVKDFEIPLSGCRSISDLKVILKSFRI